MGFASFAKRHLEYETIAVSSADRNRMFDIAIGTANT
jgi:hypothetical protein